MKVRGTVKALATLGIVVYGVLTIAILATGDFAFDLAGIPIKSNSLDPLVKGLATSVAVRLALATSLANATLIAVGTLAGVGLSELALRLVPVPLAEPHLVEIHQPSDRYSYELIPGSSGLGTAGEWIEINADGYRSHNDSPLENTRRIVVLGDSFTFGMGVDAGQGYVAQLEDILRVRTPAADIRTINLGVIAYGFWHYLELLDHRVGDFDPDLIVIGMFIDDILHPTKPANVKPTRPFVDTQVDEYSSWRLVNVYRNVITWLEARYRSQRGADYLRSIDRRREWLGPDEPVHDYYRVQTGTLGNQTYQGFRASVEALAAWSTNRGIPVLVVLIPDSTQLGSPERQVVNRQVAVELERAGIPLVDVTADFESVPDPKTLFLFPIDAHTNPAGHRRIAEAIAAHPRLDDLGDIGGGP